MKFQAERISADLRNVNCEVRIAPNGGEGQQIAENSARGADQRAFAKKFPDQAETRGAKRKLDRGFLSASNGEREQKVRYVGAGDKQNEQNQRYQDADEDFSRGYSIWRQKRGSRENRGAVFVFFGISRGELRGKKRHLRLRLTARNARLQAGEKDQMAVAAVVGCLGRNGQQEVAIQAKQISGELLWRDANDR